MENFSSSDLNVDVPRNVYDSTLEVDEEMVDIEEVVQEVADVPVRERCSCKGQCARKTGRGACICRAANLACDDGCKCAKQKCKNKPVETDAEVHVADGATRFEDQMQQSDQNIKEFVATLNEAKREEVLIRLLSMGRGSLDFARNLVDSLQTDNVPDSTGTAEDPEDPPPPPQDQPILPWCKCRVCRVMESEIENVCCKRVRCLTTYQTFANICLDRDVLEVCIKARCDIRADEFNFSMESFRKAAYRQYALWSYGKLGRGNRRVLPACVVRMIRRAYPAPDNRYMGFRAR